MNASSAAAFTALRDKPLTTGVLVFPNMDQMDFTGPFAVLSRLKGARIVAIGAEKGPFKELLGFTITPDCDLTGAPEIDVLQVPADRARSR
jgi:cyclohexyl-isocyanide hydratase